METMKVLYKKHGNVEVTINAEDFDPELHEKVKEPKAAPKAGDDKGGDAGKAGKSGADKK